MQRELSAPLLNELCLPVFGGESAQVGQFGVVTQANRQGAPSRNPVLVFGVQALGHSPL
jgi:hypothetical protein